MTASANSLTARASRGLSGQPTTWMMPAREIRVALTALAELGHDVSALIDAAGLTAIDLDDPDVRISCEAYGTLIACAQQRRFTANLGMEVARRTPLGAYPLLDYLVLTSDTVGAGVRQLARYFRIEGIPIAFDIRDEHDPVDVRISASAPFSLEYVVSLMAFHLRHETDGRFTFAELVLRHQPDDAAAMAAVLGCPVRTMSTWDGVTISRERWQVPLRRRDPILRGLLETQANEILTRLPSRQGVALDVQRALTEQAVGGSMRIEAIARHLAMSARSLQRRLSDEGLTYQGLVDETRKEAATRYITDSALSLAEIAYLVGYSEPASFHRAFKRWYDVTPEEFRTNFRAQTSGVRLSGPPKKQ